MPLVLSFSLILTHLGVLDRSLHLLTEARATAVAGESNIPGIDYKEPRITSVIY